jgi:hypothetical protein
MTRFLGILIAILPFVVVDLASGDEPSPPPAFTSPRAKEAISERDAALKKADEDLVQKLRDARAALDKKLDAAIKSVMKAGDLDEANRINALRKMFETDPDIDAHDQIAALTSPAAKEARAQYEAATQRARESHERRVGDITRSCVKKLDGVLKEAMRKGDLDEAKRIDTEKKAQEDELASSELKRENGWIVLFRSSDPSIWNTETNKGESSYAVPLRKAPRMTRWVRLTRCDTKELVILGVTKPQLSQRPTDGEVAWEGSLQFAQGGRHLGIDKASWHCVVSDGGKIMVTHDRGNRGWGFGHKVHVNDKQYWSWEGEEIPETVFEIAVKDAALTKAEAERVLR